MKTNYRALAAALVSGLLAMSPALAQPPAEPATKQPAKTEPVPTPKPADKPADKAAEPAKQPQSKPADKPADTTATKEQTVYVHMKTSMGDIVLELDAVKAPLSVANFVKYVDKGHYDGTIFHRVINGFMIQGGGFTSDMKQKSTDAPIANEGKNGLRNALGTIAMARTNDPNSATAQFYINVSDNAALNASSSNPGYAVFGKVIAGMDVVDKIKAVKTGVKSGMNDVPVATVTIEKVKKLTADEAAALKPADKN